MRGVFLRGSFMNIKFQWFSIFLRIKGLFLMNYYQKRPIEAHVDLSIMFIDLFSILLSFKIINTLNICVEITEERLTVR